MATFAFQPPQGSLLPSLSQLANYKMALTNGVLVHADRLPGSGDTVGNGFAPNAVTGSVTCDRWLGGLTLQGGSITANFMDLSLVLMAGATADVGTAESVYVHEGATLTAGTVQEVQALAGGTVEVGTVDWTKFDAGTTFGAVVVQTGGAMTAQDIRSSSNVGLETLVRGSLTTETYEGGIGIISRITILDGGNMTVNGQLALGGQAGDAETLQVIGAGSSLTYNKILTIGGEGDGYLSVRGGARQTLGGFTVATQASSGSNENSSVVNGVRVENAGSELRTRGAATVGQAGEGHITAWEGGKITIGTNLKLAVLADSSGDLYVDRGGVITVNRDLIAGAGDVRLQVDAGSLNVRTTSSVEGALHIGVSGQFKIGKAGSTGEVVLDGDLVNDAGIGRPGIDILGGTLTITGDLRGDGLISIGDKARLEFAFLNDASVESRKGSGALNILHDDTNNDTFDYQSDNFENFDEGARQIIDGGGEEPGGINDGRDLLKLPGDPSQYRILTVLDDTWPDTISNITHFAPGDATQSNPLHFIVTNDVEKVEFENAAITNVVKTSGGVYVELAQLALESYADDSAIYDGLIARNWRPLSAIELGFKPSDFGEGPLQYQFVNGIYHSKSAIPLAPKSDCVVAAGVVQGKATIAIAFRGTDEGLNGEFPSFIDFQATLENNFRGLLDALKDYIDEYGIEQVLVTGHSLGSAMTQALLTAGDFQDPKFKGFGFASPGAEQVAPASDQLCNFIHTGDAIRATSLGGKQLAGPVVWVNSLYAKGDPVQQHSMQTYLWDMQDLVAVAGDSASPFFGSSLAAALRGGERYAGVSLGVAPGSAADDIIDCAPRSVDFNPGFTTDRYVLAGAGRDFIRIDNSAALLANGGPRIIDGGTGLDMLELLRWDSAQFASARAADGHIRLKFNGATVGDLYRVEYLMFRDKILKVDGTAARGQTATGPATSFQIDQAFDYADSGNIDNLTITGTADDDVLYLGHGRKTASLGDGNDHVIAKHDDSLPGQSDNAILNGENGNDLLIAGAGRDRLFGGDGDDRLEGGIGNDTLAGGLGFDRLDGGAGIDTASYRSATEAVTVSLVAPHSNSGEALGDSYLSIENVLAGRADDTLAGDRAANRLSGGGGNDILSGLGGNDRLEGGDGSDRLVGGNGRDILAGGAARDIFLYAATGESPGIVSQRDVIADFQPGLDRIDLSAIDAIPGGSDDPFEFRGEAGFNAPGQLRIFQEGDNTVVEINTASNGEAEMSIQLAGIIATMLSAADFLL